MQYVIDTIDVIDIKKQKAKKQLWFWKRDIAKRREREREGENNNEKV